MGTDVTTVFGLYSKTCLDGKSRHATGNRHGNREDVINEQRSTGDQRPVFTEIFPRDNIRITTTRIGVNCLAITAHHNDEQCDNNKRDRYEPRVSGVAGTSEREEDDKNFPEAYAVEEMASLAKTGSATFFDSRW